VGFLVVLAGLALVAGGGSLVRQRMTRDRSGNKTTTPAG